MEIDSQLFVSLNALILSISYWQEVSMINMKTLLSIDSLSAFSH